jgi:hypothetical protein
LLESVSPLKRKVCSTKLNILSLSRSN